ncbi:TonB-dependent receptor [Burkholderiaceae bacterium DAT-1]|nr:TonB-dependent receptor [Burkholderiaceae bacterium DAT-1]
MRLSAVPCYSIALLLAALASASAEDSPTQSDEVGASSDRPKQAADRESASRRVDAIRIDGSRNRDTDERRSATASKLVFSREELDRYGDNSVGEMLKRLPGVTVSGRPGRGGDIRMRGMGNGYTHIMINGEPAPRGFSMDSLSPDQIERIEVYRAPVAEHSTRAIAGSINIILREDFRKSDSSIKLSATAELGHMSSNAVIQKDDHHGAFSYSLSATIMRNNQANDTLVTTQGVDRLTGEPFAYQQHDEPRGRSEGIHFTPRLTWKLEGGDTLNIQPFFMSNHVDHIGQGDETGLYGPVQPNAFARAESQTVSRTTMARTFTTWQHKMADDAKLQVRLSVGLSDMGSDSFRSQFDLHGTPLRTQSDHSDTRETSLSTGGKYTQPLGESHQLAAGWDLEFARREQTRHQVVDGQTLFPDSGDNLDARTSRVALFAQDEWNINPQWSAYAGLRWEGIQTESDRNGTQVSNQSSVWSPLLHAVWRIPGHPKDQVRASLTRSYRSPALADLIARPSYSLNNSPTSPDSMGNPDLKPELATGVDVAFEHYFDTGGLLSISVFNRTIQNLMRSVRSLQQDIPGDPAWRWVNQKQNVGTAVTRGIELEAKFRLEEILETAIPLDVRSNVSLFQSSVEGVSGPYNRIDQQPSATANLGLDYRLRSLPITLGGNYNWTPDFSVNQTDQQVYTQSAKRVFDLYALWRMSPSVQLHVSGANLLGQDYLTSNQVAQQTAKTRARSYASWTARLEIKF